MDRSVVGHSVYAALGAGLAFLAWLWPSFGGSDREVTVVNERVEDLAAVEWKDDKFRVVLERQQPSKDDLWVRITTLSQTPKPPAAGPAGQDPSPLQAEPEPKPKTFPGSEQAGKLLGKLANLKAARSLGRLSEEKLAGFGLDEPKGELALRFGEGAAQKRVELKIGSSTYGSGDSYVLGPGDEVFLLRSSTLSGLRYGASGMLDRSAVGIERTKIKRVVIRAGVLEREVVQRNGEDEKSSFFADPAEPEQRLAQVSNWLDRALKLRVADVSDDMPAGEPQLVLEFVGEKSDGLGTLKLWQPDAQHARATSTHFATPVTVSKANAEAILRDVEEILKEGR